MRLSEILKKKPFCNIFIYVLISILLLIISIKYPLFYLLLGFYIIFIIFKKRKILLPICIFLLIFEIIILIKNLNKIENNKSYDVYVSDVIDDNKFIGYIGYNKVLLYSNEMPKPGDLLNLEISFYDIDNKSYDNDFDNEYYLKSNNLLKSGKVLNTKFIKSGFSIYNIKYYYSNYLKSILSDDSYSYVKALVFGDNILESNIKDSYSILGLSHILAISGFHIIFLFNIISFILLKLFHYYKKNIPIFIISIFVIIIGAPLSSIRALLFLIIGNINIGKIKYSKLDILSISCILMLMINPYYLFNNGFILSFLVSAVIIFKNMIKVKNKSYLFNLFYLYILIFFITLPFVVNMNNRISILSILLSPILSTILGYILLPISYILSIIPISDFIFKYIFMGLNIYVVNLGNLLPIIHFESFNIYFIVIYYFIFILFLYGLYKNRGIYYFVLLFNYLLLIYCIRYVNPVGRITFINSGQGDSSIIELPYSRGIMVIDCFNSIKYLKSRGINNIDYLVLTHSDNDHIGDYKEIIEEFNVKNIFYSKYDDKFNLLLKGYNNKYPINYLSKLNDDNFNIDILGPINKYDDHNSNSIVLKINIYNHNVLYTGDMTIAEENDLINKYNYKLKSDILKVAHHGSNTSSSMEFLNLVKPKYSIISVGKNNNYGLPNVDIVNRLNKISNVYMTKDCGNIDIYFYKDKYGIETYIK